jgi:hypothetical protein
MSNARDKASAFLGGALLQFQTANELWKQLKDENELSLARLVLARMRREDGLLDGLPANRKIKGKLCQQHAELTSKDPELGASSRHDTAIKILGEMFELEDPSLDGDAETLGIAGGICKRRWMDLGQYEDLLRAAEYYTRGAKSAVGDDGYAHINAAFMQDLRAHASGAAVGGAGEAQELRERTLKELTPLASVESDGQWLECGNARRSVVRARPLCGSSRCD